MVIFYILFFLLSITTAQAQCVYTGPYPWHTDSCITANDLNSVVSRALNPTWAAIANKPTTLEGYGISNALNKANNLSDLTNTTVARSSLGLGSLAIQNANNVAISGGTITGLAPPVSSTDVATKAYVDQAAISVSPQLAVKYATAAVLPNTPTYANGTLGVGATLTSSTNTDLVVDGSTVGLNERVLVKNQADPTQNGAYQKSQTGTGSVPWILTRVTDWDQSAEMKAESYFFVQAGTANSATSWFMSSAVPIVVGTNSIVFQQFSASQSYAAGSGLTLTGNQFSITNPSMTLAGHVVSLGGTQTFSAVDLTNGVSGTGAVILSTSPTLTNPSITGTLNVSGAATFAVATITGAGDRGLNIVSTGTGTPNWYLQTIVSGGDTGRLRIFDALNAKEILSIIPNTGHTSLNGTFSATSSVDFIQLLNLTFTDTGTNTSGLSKIDGVTSTLTFGGGSTGAGNRNAVWGTTRQVGVVGYNTCCLFESALFGWVDVVQGNTNPAQALDYIAIATLTQVAGTSTQALDAKGGEFAVNLSSTATTKHRYGVSAVSGGGTFTPSARGTIYDAAFSYTTTGTGDTWKIGYALNDITGVAWPNDSNGVLIGVYSSSYPPTAGSLGSSGIGIELGGITFGSWVFHSDHFGIKNDGSLLVANASPALLRGINTSVACNAGGDQRLGMFSGYMVWQVNTAAGCDYSTGPNAITVDRYGVVSFPNSLAPGGASVTLSGQLGVGAAFPLATSWLETKIANTTQYSTVAALNSWGLGFAVLGGVRMSDSSSTGANAFGVGAFALCDTLTGPMVAKACWSYYAETWRSAGSFDQYSHVAELDMVNFDTPVAITPYAMTPNGITPNIWLASGRPGVSSLTDATAAIGILNNGAKFLSGIVFSNTALTGNDGTTGTANAIVMPKGDAIAWYESGGTMVAQIRSDATAGNGGRMIFANGGTFFQGHDGTIAAKILDTVSAANYPILFPATSGNNPGISTSGGNLSITSTSGVVNITGSLTVSALPTSAGSGGLYVCIDSAGTEYKKSSCP